MASSADRPGCCRRVHQHFSFTGLKVHDGERAVGPDLVGAIQVAPGLGAGLIDGVHVGEVVLAGVDVQHGLIADPTLGAVVRDDKRLDPAARSVGHTPSQRSAQTPWVRQPRRLRGQTESQYSGSRGNHGSSMHVSSVVIGTEPSERNDAG